MLIRDGRSGAAGAHDSIATHHAVAGTRVRFANARPRSYHADLGISVQGQSAADAWKEIDRLAKKWSIPVSVEFSWRQNPKAQHPGRIGLLRSGNA